ncbi:MAG: hypothetical protein U0R78_10755 [Nocardioidaceae bacterium]
MTLTAVPVERVAPPRAFVWVRVVLAGLWLALLVGMVVVGERDATLGDLRSAIASRSIDSVTVSGGLVDGTMGAHTQQVRWREHGIQRVTTVLEVSHPGGHRGSSYPVVHGDVGDWLQTRFPDLMVHRGSVRLPAATVWGFNGPSWFAAVALTAVLATFTLVVTGPSPWRATRWAWFWLMWTPIGALAFVVLSGPVWGLPAPRSGRRGLTGGWAFLLSLVVGELFRSR